MIGKEKLFKPLEKVLAESKANETEIVYVGTELGTTRYANSVIHQNVYENNCQIYFRSVLGKRIGVASVNSLAPSDLKRTLDDSCEIAGMSPEAPSFPGLVKPAKYRTIDAFDPGTAGFTPRSRAVAVKRVISILRRKKFSAAGALSTSVMQFAILNSKGVRAYQPITAASINITAMSETSSGYATRYGQRVEDLDIERLAHIATDKCELSQNPISVKPGEYEVILEPRAVADLVAWLNYVGFRAKPYEEKTSFMVGKIGRKITSEKITICDDAFDKKMVGIPFDFEGVPKRRLVFVDRGVARGVTIDRTIVPAKGTGHAILPDQSWFGAWAWNLCMSPGRVKRTAMIKGVKKGILVTRFHYIRGKVDTADPVLSGMTRDGTFLIEDGRIKCGIKNLRFTDSILRAFRSIVAVSRETEAVEPDFAAWCVVAPTIHLRSFRFTSATEY